MDLSWLARGVPIPDIADPVDLYTKQMNLAQVGRAAKIQEMAMETARRAQVASEGVGQGLGMLRDPNNDEEVFGVLQQLAPEARAGFIKQVQDARKNAGDVGKDRATTRKTETETAAARLELVGGIAGALAQAPTRQNFIAAQGRLAQAGIDPKMLAVPDGEDPVGFFTNLAQGSIKAKEQVEARDRGLVRDETILHNRNTEGLTGRGQDLTAQTAAAGQDVTRRGQSMADSRARDFNATARAGVDATREATRANQTFQGANQLRDEFNKQSGDFVKVRDAHNRVLASAKDPSAAGDLALIFNYMKVLDPGSTVREGEFATAQNSGGIPDRVMVMYNRALRGERLAPDVRADFVNRSGMLYKEMEQTHEQLREQYTGLAQRGRIDPQNVIVDYKPKAAAVAGPNYGGKGVKVQTPDGKTFTFPDEAAAARFKQQAGIP